MKKQSMFIAVIVTMGLGLAAGLAFGADVTVTPATDAVSATPDTGGILPWFSANSTLVVAAALALSELLAMIPSFKGNGIMDSIVKILRAMAAKKPAGS